MLVMIFARVLHAHCFTFSADSQMLSLKGEGLEVGLPLPGEINWETMAKMTSIPE